MNRLSALRSKAMRFKPRLSLSKRRFDVPVHRNPIAAIRWLPLTTNSRAPPKEEDKAPSKEKDKVPSKEAHDKAPSKEEDKNEPMICNCDRDKGVAWYLAAIACQGIGLWWLWDMLPKN